MKKVLALVLTLSLAAVLLSGCGGEKKEAKEEKTAASGQAVVVGTNPTFPPFEFQDDSGNMKGFDLDLMRAIAEEEGFSVDFKSLSFESLIPALKNGEINAIASGMSIKPERLEQVDFSNPYMDASLGIYVASSNDKLKGLADLADKKVAAQSGTTGSEEVQALAKDKKIGEAKILEDYNLCFLELTNGGSDAVLIDVPVAENYMKKNNNVIKMIGDPYVADFYGIAVAKGNKELTEKINSGFNKVIKNGKYEELCKKYDLPVPESIINGTAKVKGVNA